MLDFRINTFLCVCQTMNYTKAAAQLNITQPAVSSHIHYLEDYYGTSLFLYRNKKLYLTRQGEILKERLQTMQNDEVQLKQELRPEDTGIKCLSFGVTMTVGEYAVVNPLAGFLKRHPEFERISEKTWFPYELESDGFYAAVLTKTGSAMVK